MKTVGMLSMQRIKNYGSFFQAYCLKKIVEDFGYETIFVDYRIGKPLVNSYNNKSKLSKLLKYKASIKNKIKYLIYKKRFSNNFKILGLTNTYNYTPYVDILLIGSDEVFNCLQGNTNVGYSLELFGKNNNAKIVATYAASFGNTKLKDILKYKIQDELQVLISNINYISLRDKNSIDIINSLTNKEINYNLDPVLIYDLKNEIQDIKVNEKYILIYTYLDRFSIDESNYIKKLAKENNLKIYSVGGIPKCTDKFIDCNPFKLLPYFKKAEFIITDTFHGAIFSIINHKEFVTIKRKNNMEKLNDLLNKLDLISRFTTYKNIKKVLSKKIDYSSTDKIILKEKEKSLKYFRKIFK